MHSPTRALVYGAAIWFLSVSLGVVMALVAPAAAASALFRPLLLIVLAALTAAFALRYGHRTGARSIREGLLVGLVWVAVMIALDLTHHLMAPFDIATYLRTQAPWYVIIPAISFPVMGRGATGAGLRGGRHS
jgi:hypothetical protein